MTLLPAMAIAAAVTGSLDVSDRSEIRVRDSNEPVGRAMDLETTPAVGIGLSARAWQLELGYGPRLTLRQVDHLPMPEALHHGLLSLRFLLRHGELALRSDTSYGTASFSSLALPSSPGAAPEALPTLQPLPGATTIGYVSSLSGVALRYGPIPRFSLTARADYTVSGGTDAPARAVVPFQQGPVGTFEAEWAATRRDRVIAGISVTQAIFSPGPDDVVGEARAAWRRRLDRRTEASFAAGAALVFREGVPDRSETVYPVAEAAVEHRIPPQRIEARLSARLGPVVSWLNGLVDERLQGDALLAFRPRPTTAVRVQLGLAQTVPFAADTALTLVLGEAAVTLDATRAARIELGTRGAWQKQRGIEPLPPQWVLFAGARFDAPTLRF